MVEVDISSVCRLCLTNSHLHCDIFERKLEHGCELYVAINEVCQINIVRGDGLPSYICCGCFVKVSELQLFKYNGQRAQNILMHLLATKKSQQQFAQNSGMGPPPRLVMNDLSHLMDEGYVFCTGRHPGSEANIDESHVIPPHADLGQASMAQGVTMMDSDSTYGSSGNEDKLFIKLEPQEDDDSDSENESESGDGSFTSPAETSLSVDANDMTADQNTDRESLIGGRGQIPDHQAGGSMEWPAEGSIPNRNEQNFAGKFRETSFPSSMNSGMTGPHPVLSKLTKGRSTQGDDLQRPPQLGIRVNPPPLTLFGRHIPLRNMEECGKPRWHIPSNLPESSRLDESSSGSSVDDSNVRDESGGNMFAQNDLSLPGPSGVTLQAERQMWVCNQCESKFSAFDGLQNHMRVHSRQRPHTCEVCQKSFSYINCLKAHQRAHAKGKHILPIASPESYAKVKRPEQHKAHPLVRAFVCNVCGKRFKTKSILLTHVLTHRTLETAQPRVPMQRGNPSDNIVPKERILKSSLQSENNTQVQALKGVQMGTQGQEPLRSRPQVLETLGNQAADFAGGPIFGGPNMRLQPQYLMRECPGVQIGSCPPGYMQVSTGHFMPVGMHPYPETAMEGNGRSSGLDTRMQ